MNIIDAILLFSAMTALALLPSTSVALAIFFYASFFPAFIDLAHLSRWDVLVIAMLTVISVGGVKLGYAYGAEKMVGLAGRHRRVRGVKVAAGGLMMGAGAWLIAGTAGQS